MLIWWLKEGLTSVGFLAMKEEGRRWTDRSNVSNGSVFRVSPTSDPGDKPILTWGSSLEVGIEVIDQQHQRLLKIFNSLVASETESISSDILRVNLADLMKYTRYHFGTEEEMMRKWPITPSHKKMHLKAHQSFINFIDRAYGLAEDNPDDVALHVTAFLAKWLLHHIMEVDSRLAIEVKTCQSGDDLDLVSVQSESLDKALVDSITEMNDNLGLRTFEVLDLNSRLKVEISRSQELAKVNYLMAEVNSAVVLSNDETAFMNLVCAKIVEILGVPLAWIGRPETASRFNLIAAVGDAEFMDVSPANNVPITSDAEESSDEDANGQTLVDPSELAVEIEIRDYVEGARDLARSFSVAVPIIRKGQSWAVLTTCFLPETSIGEITKSVLGEVSKSLSIGLERLDTIEREKKLHEQVEYQALHDALTGLPNRRRLDEYLPGILESARRNNFVVAVGMLDLDDFKMVNDTWGHQAGDIVLQNLAGRLRLRLRTGDLLARLGGDEFVIVFESTGQEDARHQMESVLQRLHEAVDAPFEVAPGCHVTIEMSLGLAIYPLDATDGETMLRQADIALYQAKATKGNRSTWWQMGSNVFAQQDFDQSFDHFGEESIGLLASVQDSIHLAGIDFVDKFYSGLGLEDTAKSIFSNLGLQEMEKLKLSQAEHYKFVLSDSTTQSQLLSEAHRLGIVHSLVGVDNSTMLRAYELYQNLLNSQLGHLQMEPRDKFQLLLVSKGRLNEDLQAQLQTMQATSGAYESHLHRPMPEVGGSWSDIESAEIEELSKLPGILTAVNWRLGSDGSFRFFYVNGQIKDEVSLILDCSGTVPDEMRTSWQCSILAQAWRAERVTSIANLADISKTVDEITAVRRLGIRSAVVVPVFDGQHRVESVVELFGAFLNQFESNGMRQWIQGIQRRWADVKSHYESYSSTPYVTPGLGRQYREELFNGGLEMYMQPIVEIKTGRAVRFEALARLKTGEDLVVTPGAFIPLLGNVELSRLFRLGLDQTLTWAKRWEEHGISVDVSVNLSPTTLLEPDCQNWVRDALDDHEFDPSRVGLELFETLGVVKGAQKEAIEGLREIGVKPVLDDLRSGYGGLLEFSTIPFDTVKVDREIVAQLYSSPLQTLSLLGKIIKLGREFGREVVIVGLEDMGMLEAVMFLGASLVQGYQLAYPMPPDKVEHWIREFAFPTNTDQIQTYLGALTYLLSTAHRASIGDEWFVPDCILAEFLSNKGVEAEPAMLLHHQVHREATLGQSYRRLLQWLIDKVRLSPFS